MSWIWDLSSGRTTVQVKAQGTYIGDKIDLLIEYLLVDPFQSLFRRAFKQDVRTFSPTMLQAQRTQEIADQLLPCGAAGVSVGTALRQADSLLSVWALCACCWVVLPGRAALDICKIAFRGCLRPLL